MPQSKIIDFHTHFYISEVGEDPIAFAKAQGEPHWQALVTPEGKRTLQGWANSAQMLEQMQEANIDKAVLLGWYWENTSTCKIQNQWYADLKSVHPDSFEAFAAIHPPSIKQTHEQLCFAVDNGFVGIGEIHPAVQGFSLQDNCWTQVVEFAIEHDLLINLHVTEPVGRPYHPRAETIFKDIQWLIEHYPEMRLILSHWGGLIFMHELNPYISKKWKNVYYDTSASPLLYRDKVFQIAVDAIGAEKFIFGSDYPLIVYPGKQSEPDFVTFLERVKAVGLHPDDLHKLLFANGSSLLEPLRK